METVDWSQIIGWTIFISMLILIVAGVTIATVVLGIVKNIISLLNGQVQNQGRRLDQMDDELRQILNTLPQVSTTVIVHRDGDTIEEPIDPSFSNRS